jgi:hypothetical protein
MNNQFSLTRLLKMERSVCKRRVINANKCENKK